MFRARALLTPALPLARLRAVTAPAHPWAPRHQPILGQVLPYVGIAFILAVAGCGADPGRLLDPSDPVREQLAYPAEGLGAPDQDALDRLMAMERAHRAVAGASYSARVYARGSLGGAKPKEAPWAGGAEWEDLTVWEVAYARPDVHRLKAVEGTLKGRVGLRVLLEPGHATVRYPGLRGLIAHERDLQHEDLIDQRGHALAELTLQATVGRLAGSATARLVGETRLDGVPLDLVEIPRTPAFDREVAREVVGIARQGAVLRLHAMYDAAGRKVYEQQVLGFRAQAAAPGKLTL